MQLLLPATDVENQAFNQNAVRANTNYRTWFLTLAQQKCNPSRHAL